ncbi:MAG: permease-like cell division protein FtsX [Rikenellaceae bacterium]
MRKDKRQHKSYFIATLSIALVLFLLGVVGYISYLVEKSAAQVVDQIQISALLKEKIDISQVDSLVFDIKKQVGVKNVAYISKEMAADSYKKVTGNDFAMFIDENPLPASIDITFAAGAVSQEKIDEISKLLSSKSVVEEVLLPRGVIGEVLGHVYKIKFILYSFFITLFIISIVLINNAIKLTIRSKRFLIKSMKLVGATNNFIRRPFIVSAVKQGLWASLSAWMLFSLTLLGLNRGVTQIGISKEELFPISMIYLAMSFIGITISVICTYLAINKQLHQKNSQLHIY